jgi:GT2 family glycosyltransferase
MFDLTCSIVLYNHTVTELQKGIQSFLAWPGNSRLFLIDNSDDDRLRQHFNHKKIEYIFNGRNVGFGAGHNIAIQKIINISRYHLVMNPDVEFKKRTIDGLLRHMDARETIGMIVPKVLYPNGETQFMCRLLPSPMHLICRRFLPSKIKEGFKKFLDQYELRHRDYNATMEVPNMSGCFMFIRSEVFKNVGAFDERYFLYLEDVDLCRRINSVYQTIYFPQEQIVHGYQQASYRSIKLMRHHTVSAIRYFNKWGWFNDPARTTINRLQLSNRHKMKIRLKQSLDLPAMDFKQEPFSATV